MRADGLTSPISQRVLNSYVNLLYKANIPIKSEAPNRAFVRKLAQIIRINVGNKFAIEKALRARDWDAARQIISNDTFTVASYNALGKKGYQIFEALRDMGVKNPESVIERILNPISEKATLIKRRYENVGEQTDLITDSRMEGYDKEISAYKAFTLDSLWKKYNDKYGKENLLTPDMLKEYFDTWLMSPFYSRKISDVYSAKNKQPISGYPVNAKGKPKLTRGIKPLPFQSQKISQKSIESLMKEYNDVYTSIQGFVSKQRAPQAKDKKVLFSLPKNYREIKEVSSGPSSEAKNITEKV